MACHRRLALTKRNQQKLKENLHVLVPPHLALAKVHDEIIYIFMFFEHLFLKKSHILSGRSHRHSDRNMIVLLIFYHID